jgi:hypothetical protein
MHHRVINSCSILLILVGLGGYLLSGRASPTALIPAALGLLLWVAEALGSRQTSRVAGVWVPVVAVLGIAGTASGIPELFGSLFGGGGAPSMPTIARSITAILSLIALVAAGLRWKEKSRTSG